MQSLAVLSHKGGTGKTTVASHMAVAAHTAGRRAMLIDMDPQRSAVAWSKLRPAPGPVIGEAKAGTYYFTRQAAEKGRTDLMIVDTAPNCEADTLEAVRWADLCLIVVRPSFFDIQAVGRTVEAVKALGRPGLFLINQAPTGQSKALQQAADSLAHHGLPVCAVRLHSRPVFQTAVAAGLTVCEAAVTSPAASEVHALWRDIEFRLGLDRMETPLPLAANA